MFKKVISLALSVVFSLQTCGFAQAGQLNLAGYLGQASAPALDRFRPAHLRYFSYEPKSDNFQILLDKADEKGLSDIQAKDKADELMRYFRIGLSLPNDKFWVNLRPDAPEQIIDPALEQTDMGKIMLEADLQLKKDTSSLTSPQTKEGKEYWDKLYKKAGELFGTENITIPTITRPWIVPGEIIVRQSGNSAYIYKAALKVMLEEDHLKGSLTYDFKDPRMKELNGYSSQLIRELIIPQLTKEVNRAKRYAGLRQVYYSLILARWFKQSYQNSGASEHQSIRAPVNENNALIKLIDSGNLSNLTSQEPWSKDTYYQGYKKSFEQGEYNLSQTVHTPTGQLIRRYVSGGISAGSALEVNDHFDVGKVNNGIPGVGYKSILFNYASSGSELVATAASPLLESLRNKAIGKLGTYLYEDEEYNAMYVEISETENIGRLKKVFDYKVRLLKEKKKINNSEILDDFSNTLSALILIEQVKITLEEKLENIKNIYETYASLSKRNQLGGLRSLDSELKETERAMKDLSGKIETEWSRIVSSSISQEVKEIIKDIKQKTAKLELILNKYEQQQGMPEKWEDLGNLFEDLKSLWIVLEIRLKSSLALTPKERMTKELNEDIVLNEEKLERKINMGGSIDLSDKKLKKDLGGRIPEGILANGRVVSRVKVTIADSGGASYFELIAVPTKGIDPSNKYRIFLWNDVEGVILDFYIGKKISVLDASEAYIKFHTDDDWHVFGMHIKDALGISGASSALISKELTEGQVSLLETLLPANKKISQDAIDIINRFLSCPVLYPAYLNGLESEMYFSIGKDDLISDEYADVYITQNVESNHHKRKIFFLALSRDLLISALLFEEYPKAVWNKKTINEVKDMLHSSYDFDKYLRPKIKSELNLDRIDGTEIAGIIKEGSMLKRIDSLVAGKVEKILTDYSESPPYESIGYYARRLIEMGSEEEETVLYAILIAFQIAYRETIEIEKEMRLKDPNYRVNNYEVVSELAPFIVECLFGIIDEVSAAKSISKIYILVPNLTDRMGSTYITKDNAKKMLGLAKTEYETRKEQIASSGIISQGRLGAVDFRAMDMLIQPAGSFSGLDFSPVRLSSSALEAMDLDKGLENIKQMASSSMLPSPQRLKEYVSACIFKGKIDEKADDFILSMLEVFQLQAEEGIESASQDREAVVLADTRRYVLPEKKLAASNSYSLN